MVDFTVGLLEISAILKFSFYSNLISRKTNRGFGVLGFWGEGSFVEMGGNCGGGRFGEQEEQDHPHSGLQGHKI